MVKAVEAEAKAGESEAMEAKAGSQEASQLLRTQRGQQQQHSLDVRTPIPDNT